MTVSTPVRQHIRILDAQGVSWRRIGREAGASRQTAGKHAELEDCSPKPPEHAKAESKLDPFKPVIDKWLESDRLMPRKRRHTAMRVRHRLRDEHGYEGSCQLVRRYVRQCKRDWRDPGDGFMEPRWEPGVMRVDFGEGLACIRGGSGEGALPGGGVPVFEHALGGRAARGERRMRVRGFGDRVRAYRPGAARAGVRQRHRRRAPGRVGQNHHRGRVPTVRRALPGRGRVPQSRPAGGRRATWRTRSGSSGATSWSPCPTRGRAGSSPPGCSRAATRSPGTRITARMFRSRTCSPGRRRACRRCPGSRTTRAVGRRAGPTGRATSGSIPTATSPAPRGDGPWRPVCARSRWRSAPRTAGSWPSCRARTAGPPGR